MLPLVQRVLRGFNEQTPALLSEVSFYPPSQYSKHDLKTMLFTFRGVAIGFVCYFWANNCSLFIMPLQGLEIKFSLWFPGETGRLKTKKEVISTCVAATSFAIGLRLCVCVFQKMSSQQVRFLHKSQKGSKVSP